jgi:hypothetical protein
VRPLRVQVRDERGAPAPRQRVQFRTLVGDGAFSAESGVTDFAGFTQVAFTPLAEGALVVEASVGGGPRTTFQLTAIDRSRLENPAIFEIAGGNGQSGGVGTILPLPATVRVANEFDQPLENFPVLFTATTDGAILLTANEGDFIQSDTLGRPPSPSDSLLGGNAPGRQIVAFTDPNGIAGALVRLATRPGTNVVVANTTFASGTPDSVVFTAQGELGGPSSADSIIKISGDLQNVEQDTTTTGTGGTSSITFNPMVVQVTDRFGNPIQGVTVFFRVSVGFGTLSNSLDVTDAGGFAETVYTSAAGSTGGIAVSATAPGVGTATFTGSIEAIGTPPDTTGGGGGGGGGGGNNPVPVTSSIAPNAGTAGGGGFTLTVNGGSFVASSTVLWDGAVRPTTFVGATQLQAAIPASDIASPGSAQVTVFNPAPGGGTSNAQTFTINP